MTALLVAFAVSSLAVFPDDAPVREVERDSVALPAPQVEPPNASGLASKRARQAELSRKLEGHFGPAPALLIIFSIPQMISGSAVGVLGGMITGSSGAEWGVLLLLAGIIRFGAGVAMLAAGPTMAFAREREAEAMRKELESPDDKPTTPPPPSEDLREGAAPLAPGDTGVAAGALP
jgi:hypothetical protein